MKPLYAMDRRGFLRVGGGGVAGCCISTSQSRASSEGDMPGHGRAKSVLLVMLSDNPNQLDTVDPKPDAPAEVRGEFSTIGTKIAGVRFCEHLPKLA